MICLGHTTLLLNGEGSFFYPGGTEGSEVVALSSHSEPVQDLSFTQSLSIASVKSPQLDESDCCWASGKRRWILFCLFFTRAATTSLAESGKSPVRGQSASRICPLYKQWLPCGLKFTFVSPHISPPCSYVSELSLHWLEAIYEPHNWTLNGDVKFFEKNEWQAGGIYSMVRYLIVQLVHVRLRHNIPKSEVTRKLKHHAAPCTRVLQHICSQLSVKGTSGTNLLLSKSASDDCVMDVFVSMSQRQARDTKVQSTLSSFKQETL